MLMMKLLLLTALFMMMLKPQPINFLIALMMSTCILTNTSFLISNFSWIPMVMILAFVGGLMVMYTFIICLSPNEPSKEKNKAIYLSIMIPMFMMINKMDEKSKSFSKLFIFSWNSMYLLTITLMICLAMMSKMSYDPSKTMKTLA